MRKLLNELTDSLTLTQEDTGLEVAILQRLLVFYKYLPAGNVNGIFNQATDNAVRQFQHDNALYEDGLVGIGLLLARDLLSVPLPESVSQWVKSDTAISTITQQLQADLFKTVPTEPGEVERSLFHIRTREGLLAKLRSLRGLLQHSGWFTPTQNDREAILLPDYLSPLYYVIRPFRVIQKYLTYRNTLSS